MTHKQESPATQGLAETLLQAYRYWNAGHADQAEILCQRVLAEWPGQPDALHLQGLMAHAYGNLSLALSYLRQACQSPRAPGMFFRNLTEMCRQRGLLAEGEQAGRQAVALDPQAADGWNNLGIVLQESGKIEESIACLHRALELCPNDPKTLNNLGNSCRLAGHSNEAEGYYRRALDLEPESAQTYNNLAALSVARGDFDAGIEYARAALACEPQFADAYLNLADIESTRFNHHEALRWLDALLKFAPNHVGALNARTRILLQGGWSDEAQETVRRATLLAPEDGNTQNRLGEVLQALNRPEEALDAYRCAADMPGRQAEDALINRAIVFMECGRNEEANLAFDQVLARFPSSPRALVARADTKKYIANDPDIAALEALATSPGRLDFVQQIGVRFALAKAYFDIDDGARAFAHLNVGNRLKRGIFQYNPEQNSAWFARIATIFSEAGTPLFGAWDSERPVFIVGMPRAGSTLVEQILASHPQIGTAGELPTLRLAVNRAGSVFPDTVTDWPDEVWRMIGHDYLQATAPFAADKTRLIDKMPANFVYAGIISKALPGARIIHCRRNPVDTCLSCFSKNFVGEQPFCYDQRELGLFYRDYHRLMNHWRDILSSDQMIEVDYEKVVSDQEGQSRRLLAFLGLPWDNACLDFHRTQHVVNTASTTQVRQPIYRNAVGRWHAYADHLAPLLEALGNLAW
jgi:tetratricopeptide (TPR) repeat protein